jgi:hypothetical protein
MIYNTKRRIEKGKYPLKVGHLIARGIFPSLTRGAEKGVCDEAFITKSPLHLERGSGELPL